MERHFILKRENSNFKGQRRLKQSEFNRLSENIKQYYRKEKKDEIEEDEEDKEMMFDDDNDIF